MTSSSMGPQRRSYGKAWNIIVFHDRVTREGDMNHNGAPPAERALTSAPERLQALGMASSESYAESWRAAW